MFIDWCKGQNINHMLQKMAILTKLRNTRVKMRLHAEEDQEEDPNDPKYHAGKQ